MDVITAKPSQLARLLATAIEYTESTMLVGAPGIGKTAIVDQAAALAGIKPANIIREYGVSADPTDAKGLGWVSMIHDKPTANFIPFGNLDRIIHATEPTLFFMDDFGQSPPTVQASYMQLIHGRHTAAGQNISPFVTFIAATNRKEDKAAVSGILEPVKSRFSIYHMAFDLDDFCAWGLENGLATEGIAFCRAREGLLADWKAVPDMVNSPCPRTMERAIRKLDRAYPRDLEYIALAADIGPGAAAEMTAFLKVARNIPSLDSIILNPDTAPVPEEPDALFTISTGLARKATPANFDAILTYGARMSPEYGVLIVQDARRRDPNVQNTQAFIRWSIENSDLLK